MVHNAGGSLKVVGKVANAIGDAGEAVLRQKLVSHFGVKESHIMGLSLIEVVME